MIWLSGKQTSRVLSHAMKHWLVVRCCYSGALLVDHSHHTKPQVSRVNHGLCIYCKKRCVWVWKICGWEDLFMTHTLSREILNQVNSIRGDVSIIWGPIRTISTSGSENIDKLTWGIILCVALLSVDPFYCRSEQTYGPVRSVHCQCGLTTLGLGRNHLIPRE